MPGTPHAFIVRVWDEQIDDQGNTIIWRGSIEHVRNQTRLHFNDFEEMVRFIQTAARIKKGSPTPWWRVLLTSFKK